MESIRNQEKLDGRWYKRFEEVAFEDYEKLLGNKNVRELEKIKFLSDEVENPDLGYPELESFDLDERESTLLSLKEDVLEMEQNDAVKKIYRTKINESLATLRMLRATKNGDDRKFSRYADFIYGKPASGDIGYVVEHVKSLVVQHVESENTNKQQAALRLQEIFEGLSQSSGDGVEKSILPGGEDIPGKLESVDEAVLAFEEALQEIDATDWQVVVDSESGISNFSVSQEYKVVRIPSEEKLMSRNISKKKLKGLIEHEIKTHVARRSNGERSRLQLLGLGLDRYLKAEEGIAAYAEQQVTGATEFAGVPRFLSIALAKGLGGEMLDFRQTHTIMSDYRFLSSSKNDVKPEQARVTESTSCNTTHHEFDCIVHSPVYSCLL
tara:strand:- start:1238 stop:2383 length:1146 start_codon:yes stop_codon:yes gene_type:complete